MKNHTIEDIANAFDPNPAGRDWSVPTGNRRMEGRKVERPANQRALINDRIAKLVALRERVGRKSDVGRTCGTYRHRLDGEKANSLHRMQLLSPRRFAGLIREIDVFLAANDAEGAEGIA